MIHTVTNPRMTPEEIQSFLENFVRCVSKDLPPEQLTEIEKCRMRMKNNYKKIIRNNGGKNPILGF